MILCQIKKGVSAKVEGKSTLRKLLLGTKKIVIPFIYTANKMIHCKVILYLEYIFSNYYFSFYMEKDDFFI